MNPLLIPVIGKIIDGIGSAFGLDLSSEENKIKRAELEFEYTKLLSEQMQGQMEVNKAEAGSGDPFASRWRPFIGWVCGVAFAYHFVVQPLLIFMATTYSGHAIPTPSFDMNTLMTVLMGMLGLGVMRTYERVNGPDRDKRP